MNITHQGGIMMWPLLALSIATVAIIIERFILFTTRRFPSSGELEELFTLAKNNENKTALKALDENAPTYLPLFNILFSEKPENEKEKGLQLAGEEILFTFSKRLDFLSTVAMAAPLIGLLGTVLGMIEAFSRLSASNNIDITMLAGGIWQALITTATGLSIAIPALLAHRCFCRQHDKTAFAMQHAINTFLSQSERNAS